MSIGNTELLEMVQLSNDGLSGRKIAEVYGVHQSVVNRFLNKTNHREFWDNYTGTPLTGGTLDHPSQKRGSVTNKKSTFIFTSAQNNTKVHSGFLESLKVLAEHRDAELIVGTFTYNKNSFHKLEKGDQWYAREIREFINDRPLEVAEGLVWCGELNILPTAINPLSGFQGYTGESSCIVPHTKVNLESVPTDKYRNAKMMYTTGSITQANYLQKKAGQKAEFHHVYGALLVEIDQDGEWFARQIIAESVSGEFYDLQYRYTPHGYTEDHRVEAINWGDIHIEKMDSNVGNISFGVTMDDEASLPSRSGSHSMLDHLMPKYAFYHDITDFKVRNHHNRNNPLFKVKMMYANTEEVEFGMNQVGSFLSLVSRPWCQSVVVNSNHDAALQLWAENCNWDNDPINAEFLLECQLEMVRAVKRGDENFCLFEHMTRRHIESPEEVKFLRLDESFMICGDRGVQCGYHGHTGNNGARGTTQAYRVAGTRFNIGHQHSCGIKDGVYVSGVTGKLDMEYNKGMGGWSHSHIVTYANSKRTIVTVKGSRYKADKHLINGNWIGIGR